MSMTIHLKREINRYKSPIFIDREIVVISLRIPKTLLNKLDSLIEKGIFISRSEAIRRGIILVLKENKILQELASAD